jgi:hypothetical protein
MAAVDEPFTEGVDTTGLKEAQVLLAEPGAQVDRDTLSPTSYQVDEVWNAVWVPKSYGR